MSQEVTKLLKYSQKDRKILKNDKKTNCHKEKIMERKNDTKRTKLMFENGCDT